MITVKINDKARGSEKLIQHLHTLEFVEFEEQDIQSDEVVAEYETLEKQCITGDELVRRVCLHIDDLFDNKKCVT
ncbi:MAG: hypothetical protein LBE56_07720 [Tannerella sp.]|jgi:hypothetical protein|nr:hypothetical protein [Tannerella sp.]